MNTPKPPIVNMRDAFSFAEQSAPVPAQEEASIQRTTVTPGAFKSGAVVVLPSKAYEASEIANLIVASSGLADEPAYWRIIDTYKAGDAVKNGTDRDSTSTVHILRGDNTAMEQHGLTDPGTVTYLHPLNKEGIPELPPENSVLIYSAKGIQNITASGVPFPNTKFFHFSEDPKQSLIAIIAPVLRRDAKPKPPTPGLGSGPE